MRWTGERAAAVADTAAEEALRGGGARLLLPAFRSVIQQNPLDEPLQAKVLLLLRPDGTKSDAINTFLEIRSRLTDQLSVRPLRRLNG